MQPEYPVYIISKGRWEKPLTARALAKMSTPFRIVVEPQEFAHYAAVIDPAKILTLPFSNLGQGSIPARNWVWEHSINEGHARHWIVDDNINQFFRLNKNTKYLMGDGSAFRIMEQFTDRYVNLPMAGPNYRGLVKQNQPNIPPFYANARIYSCTLLSNRVSHRWRGRYNEDTDLSLRFLKDGYCTVLFNAFLAGKAPTMTMRGGNTDELYKQNADFDGRLEMARSLQQQHPDVVKITRKWGRWQHQVDYKPFKGNSLVRRPGAADEPQRVNDYGMSLVPPAALHF